MFNLSALELACSIQAKKISVPEVVTAHIDLIEKTDKTINAFTARSFEYALLRAKEVQAHIQKGEILSPLAGVPIGIKDNISTKDILTTSSSNILKGHTPVYNATVVDKLTHAGLIPLGKLSMDEFGMGGSSETGVSGAVRNPWDTDRVAGGSSGGSAAAVAARTIPLALGSDTGGSIRQPCSFCGITGIKPTYGAVSRYGLLAYASSLDQIGSMGLNVDDCAALLQIMSGLDAKDSTCILPQPFDFSIDETQNLKGVKIGLPRNYFSLACDKEVQSAVLNAAKKLESLGAIIEEFDMPLMDYTVPAYYVIACAEASSNLSRYDGLRYGYRDEQSKSLTQVYRNSRSQGFGLEVKRRIMLGSFVLSSGYYDAYYKKALKVRALIKDAYSTLFKRYAAILSPVAPTTAYKIGQNIDDPLKMYAGDIYTVSVNLAGLPALSLPCGFDAKGLPIGFQLIGNTFSEKQLVQLGRAYQKHTDFHVQQPKGGSAL